MIAGKKILITGATGKVARPIAEALAKENEVWCTARFSNPDARRELDALGIQTVQHTLGIDGFESIPDDFHHVIHSACNVREVAHDFDRAIRENAEGTGLLLAHCRKADSFLFVSGCVVYARAPDDRQRASLETDALGGSIAMAPSYGPVKVGTECVVRTLARHYTVPVTIARLGSAYGYSEDMPSRLYRAIKGGKPVLCPSASQLLSVIHIDDIVAHVEPLLRAATVPATIVNWVADEPVDEMDLYRHIAKLAGVEPSFQVDDRSAPTLMAGDPAARRKITGPTRVPWKEGILRTLRANFPQEQFPSSP